MIQASLEGFSIQASLEGVEIQGSSPSLADPHSIAPSAVCCSGIQ